jgi:hypothetical protein
LNGYSRTTGTLLVNVAHALTIAADALFLVEPDNRRPFMQLADVRGSLRQPFENNQELSRLNL